MPHIADWKDIKEGKVTDVYFLRTSDILRSRGVDKHVKAEFIAKSFPDGWEWAVFAGVEECAELMSGMRISVRAMAEGTLFKPYEPVMEIEGKYSDFCVYETAILGLICQASGIATRAARCKRAAGQRPVISFGARRMHPAIAPMIERNAFIGGCDGVAVDVSSKLIGEKPSGTMPHALVLILGDTVEATKAFNRAIDKKVKRVSLIDTFNDEKFDAIRVAEALGDDLYAVRLDTPASRRGSFKEILQEVRWELDQRGFKHVKLFVSGGIDEKNIYELNEYADAYGMGTYISNAPVVDFSMDIVEIDNKPIAKRGKWSGSKRVLRCKRCSADMILPLKTGKKRCKCGGATEDILKPFLNNGKVLHRLPKAKEIRNKVLHQLKKIEFLFERGDR